MEESILVSIKKMLGLEDSYTPFDMDIKVHINAALMTLTQLGVGPKEGFTISDYSTTWDQFLTNDIKLGAVKDYVYLKVKMMFDPPANSFVMDAMKAQAEEIGWRLNVQAESVETFDFMEDDTDKKSDDSDDGKDSGGKDDGGSDETKTYVNAVLDEEDHTLEFVPVKKS